ncbi:MAG TPA: hypothetical protein VL486_11755 [Verrucomicrobiae bacterium]|nr:hypothetical protein [Verrucomicrobiae bacterium]
MSESNKTAQVVQNIRATNGVHRRKIADGHGMYAAGPLAGITAHRLWLPEWQGSEDPAPVTQKKPEGRVNR